ELLTGELPFRGNTRMLLHQVLHDEPRPPRKFDNRIPRDVELICLKCLAKDPAERYPTARALAEDLGRFADDEPASGRAPGVVERGGRWARRKPTLAAAYTLGLLAMLLGVLGGAAVWQWWAAEMARARAEKAQVEAEQQREKFERFEYGRTMQVAHQEWREGN